MTYLRKFVRFAFLFTVICLAVTVNVWAEYGGLVLEWEQHWETYGVGGTCNFGTHNFFVGDVDSDGVMEMITGGMMYHTANYTRSELEAPLMIWNWDGEKFTLEHSHTWAGAITSIYAADSDGDGSTEIITAGRVINTTNSYSSLRVWKYNNEDLVLKSSYEGIHVSSIFVSDVNNDGTPEILTAGDASDGVKSYAQLCILHWNKDGFVLKQSIEWCASEDASANSVYAYDLNNDGEVEIVTGGYDNDLKNSSGQLRIWHWNGEELSMATNSEWRMVDGVYGATITGDPMGNTVVENVKVDDVDNDGVVEIVSGGFTYDGEKVNAQLRVWNWTGQTLNLEKSHEWSTEDITEIKAVALNDVNGDNHVDIVTSGITAVYGGFSDDDTPPETAQLRVWNWNSEELTLEHSEDWQVGEGVVAWNIATGDVDKDDTVEIVTVGCMYVTNLCDPDLRIWSIAKEPVSFPYTLLAALAILLATIIVIGFLFIKKKRNQH
ncbi:MAG: VCBS repeat-containing protein [Candidatus Bathyarchaeota archaeon]|nr:VCBS repeat-containing protein [Candidatus Bathyarchaeum sp.]